MESKKLKVYYAHCMAIYDKTQEKRDIELLESLGFEVVNPNTPEIQQGIKDYISHYPEKTDYMVFFYDIIRSCDVLAFRANYDGKIAAGTGNEAMFALTIKIPVIELPSMLKSRVMDVESTRQYLHEIGQR